MDLLDQYLGPSTPVDKKESGDTSLMDQYLGPSTTVETPTGVPRITVTPRVPMSGMTPEEDAKFAQETQNIPSNQPSTSKAGAGIAGLPVEYWENVKKNYQGGIDLATQGLKETASNMPLGIGKTALGGIMAVPPVPLITGAFKTAGEEIGKLTGSKEIGERAEFILGSGLPVAKAGQVAVKAMPANKAISAIVDTIGAHNIPDVINQLKSNDRLSLMDVVPATRQMAQKLITTEGPHQNKFEKFVTDRIGSAKNATTDIYDASMGTPVNVVDKINSLKQAAKDIGKNEIEPAIKGSGFVDVSNVINKIDAKLKPGVNSVITAGEPLALGDIEKPLAAVRKFIMDDNSVRTDPKSLHQFQSALRAKADDLLNSTSGQDRQKGHALMAVRNDIVNAIDNASPKIKSADGTETGSYKQALSSYRDEKQVENAFNMGQLVTRNKLGRLEDTPEFWEQWVKGATKEELEAAREGARLAVQHQIAGFKAGARKGQDIVESEFNKDKLSSLFGKEEVNQMAKRLKEERDIAITNTQLIGNSQTAMRMKADSRVDLPTHKPNSLLPVIATGAEMLSSSQGLPGLGMATVLGSNLAGKGKFNYVTLPLAKAKNTKITDYLTATGEDREALIKMLESHIPKPKQSILQNAQTMALPVLPP